MLPRWRRDDAIHLGRRRRHRPLEDLCGALGGIDRGRLLVLLLSIHPGPGVFATEALSQEAELLDEVVGVPETIVGVLLQTPEHEGLERRVDAREPFPQWDGLVRDVLHQEVGGILVVERQRAGHHLVEHDAQGVEVGAPVDVGRLDVLRSDVSRRPEDLLAPRERGRVHDLGDPEVQYLDRVVTDLAGHQEDVLGLEVAVHDPHLVGAAEGGSDLFCVM